MTKSKENSSSLVTDGKFNFGTYNKPLVDINPLDAKVSKIPIPRFLKNIRLKEWNAFQLGNDRFFIFIAIMDIKKVILLKIDIYDKKEGKRYNYEKKVMPWAINIPKNLLNSKISYKNKNITINIYNKLKDKYIDIKFTIGQNKKLPKIEGLLKGLAENTEPMVASIPFSKYSGMYSHKANCPMEGYLTIGEEKHNFKKGKSFLIIDDQKGYYPYIMKWDWVTASYYSEDKDLIGFNLTKNQSIDEEKYNENCIWINGKIYPLPPVKFLREKNKWYIRDSKGIVNLTFSVEMDNEIKTNMLIVSSKYDGPFGWFNGYIKNSDRKINMERVFGMGERFYLRS
ncbi:DUF2804 domain-containing protein [Dethiothermospora halolimnae]|uniref:DUF2804 domain-containing protein n=1 Tax=Dethiothermospora halolimnae TaxID=3114390 RepID=UPI003CCC20E1